MAGTKTPCHPEIDDSVIETTTDPCDHHHRVADIEVEDPGSEVATGMTPDIEVDRGLRLVGIEVALHGGTFLRMISKACHEGCRIKCLRSRSLFSTRGCPGKSSAMTCTAADAVDNLEMSLWTNM